ncbi:protein arginine kinase [Limnochorda pilosa]|uniref:Protein-arginine kinase n=1 Tax=Limnochorda pilosa TaxID=1555112 RepID=A0A0K2SQ32_LIMPI|nr:protein arginine kinase [Limnochorda pilosa]BAS29122.1 ATP:guanido phosphotransferase [Limnochorda pilosa]
MSLDEVLNHPVAQWMAGEAPANDIVVGTRVRLARNLEGIPFPGVATQEQMLGVVAQVRRAVEPLSSQAGAPDRGAGSLGFYSMDELSPLVKELLVERHLISPQHGKSGAGHALALRDDERVSIMVNEEDHLRIQVLLPGMQPEEAWRLADRVDDALDGRLQFAFSDRMGYLTAWPTNVGTGLRASLMLHLPALSATEQVRQLVGAVAQLGLTVRGLYGEGSEASGNLFQLSNQVSLGRSEEEITTHLANVGRQVIQQERQAREHLLSHRRVELEDGIYRSLGIVTHARSLSTKEALRLLSDVRLGIDLGLISGIPATILQELVVRIRPAHLQRLVGRELAPPERDVQRATLIRERFRVQR